jgi:hypothetical protein
VGAVKSVVPAELWCDGQHSAEERAAAGGGWFTRLLGR